VAFEFKTGAGWTDRIGWQSAQLVGFAQSVGRPLHLVVRAARGDILASLIGAFGGTTVLDTTSFIKAIHRQRAVETITGSIKWETSPTPLNAPVDDLLAHNWLLVRRSYEAVFDTPSAVSAAG
jgi:hypothetical protein